MRSGIFCIFAAALLLAATGSHAQYKCVGDKGRVTYQQDPCPGGKAVMRGSNRGAAPAGSLPASGEPKAPPMPDEAAKICADSWHSVKTRSERFRADAARMASRASGDHLRQIAADETAQFLSSCSRFGFAAPDDAGSNARNDTLRAKIERDYGAAYERRTDYEVARPR